MDEKEHGNYTDKLKDIYQSIISHLEPAYRKQYNIRRFMSCFLLFWVMKLSDTNFHEHYWLNGQTLLIVIWVGLAWIFWHYTFWRYQGGVIDTLSRNMIYFGSLWSLIWKIVVQNLVIMIWIAFISPISGIKTWRKAVKHNKHLFIENQKNDIWN
ncbi:hypothetical protein [Pseudolactococcus carnosus]|jgi:hypothetical protein|uniref:hypothetical protein n=1 Tax=Pseudolactococcus carnosus TaxID=2749961 RepID=UPI001FBA64BA|nr:hypothetical protein [Lactococcus carnosus]MCJ2003460.1 hypothetical protein [Lactococcus carnosus]